MDMDRQNDQLLGGFLRKRRAARSRKCSDVANAVGISASYYSAIENSKALPPASTLQQILNALGFSDPEQYELKQLAAIERGLCRDDINLPDEAVALISDIRKHGHTLPVRFINALRRMIREVV